ncbi:MAG TPA: hypothetical protein VI895_03200 [Bdellovibrionota bacterium]|nr:hypothetical protein [Bdellovibrionota bacterium]
MKPGFQISPLFLLLLVTACSSPEPGDPVAMQGFLLPANPNDIPNLPDTATIVVMGRTESDFPSTFVPRTSSQNAPEFDVHNLPYQETLVFQVSGATLDVVASFPLLVDPNSFLSLGAFPAGSIQVIVDDATGVSGRCRPAVLASQKVDLQNQSIVMGIVAPAGTGTCNIQSVELVDRETKQSVLSPGVNGPFYFDSNGCTVNSGRMADTECSYIFFNIPPGIYDVQYLGAGQPIEHEVVAIAGQVMFGYDIP